MRWLRGMAAATAALVAVMGAMVVTTPSAAAEPAGCIGQDALGNGDRLQPGKALCNGNYLLRMQENGDLVLREISTGRACWNSKTFKPGAAATVHVNGNDLTLQVGDKVVKHDNSGNGTNVNLNSKGELWVGWDREAWC
jgi:hypothetical protein